MIIELCDWTVCFSLLNNYPCNFLLIIGFVYKATVIAMFWIFVAIIDITN